MIKVIKLLCLALIACFGFSTQAQAQPNPVKWDFKVEKTKKKGQYKLVATAKMGQDWAIYSQFISDEGPVPTTFEYELPANAALIDKTNEISDHKIEGMDETFGIELIKYKKEVVFEQLVQAKAKQELKGVITYMVCNNETCLPPRDVPFAVKLK